MTLFRILLAAMLAALLIYTGIVGTAHGWDLLSVFYGDIAAMSWPGQFNLDFHFMLILSALWTAWRHDFGARGSGLGLLALFGGALFLSVYLLIQTVRLRGDMEALLLGPQRAGARTA